MSIYLFAQVENVKMTSDSSIVIDKIYAGILSGGQFSIDSMRNNAFVSARFNGNLATRKMVRCEKLWYLWYVIAKFF